MAKCITCFAKRGASILSAILVRLVFTLHCVIAVWRILENNGYDIRYCLLLCGLGGLFIESIITICSRKGEEYKWFCPSVFFYLLTIVPCVWIMEIDRFEERMKERDNNTDVNVTEVNVTEISVTEAMTLSQGDKIVRGFIDTADNFRSYIPVDVESDQWVTMLEQMVQFILILGRWMLPKGTISRDELSQLLMVYIGISADIIEFFETFKEDNVKYNKALVYSILGIWSGSLLQFCLVVTATKATKNRPGFFDKKKPIEDEDLEGGLDKCVDKCFCCSSEALGILTTMLLQDAPFLSLRMLLLVKYDVKSYMHIFFTVKNSLVIIILIYRLIIVGKEKKVRRETIRRRATERAKQRQRGAPNSATRLQIREAD